MGSTKGVKEDDKPIPPMFPRLHVNDADKGGPRAPPRNKMSLYEQLSIPSHKFSSATLPPPKPGSLVPSASALQEHNDERTAYSSFYLPHTTSTPSTEKHYLRSSDGKNSKSRRTEFNGSIDRGDCNSSRAAISYVEEARTFNIHGASRKNSFKAKYEDVDDFRVPSLVHSEVLSPSKDGGFQDVERPTPFVASSRQKAYTFDSSVHLGSSRKSIHEANVSGKLSKQAVIHGEQESREALSSKEHGDESPNHSVDEVLADPSKISVVPSNRGAECKKFLDKTGYQSARLSKESPHNGSIVAFKSSNDSQFYENRNISNVLSESSSGASFGYSQGGYDDKANGLGELKNTERTGEVSEISMIDSISGMDFSPDDVVGLIGPKQFWKARREIVNQQRVFAIQVFELHRLIKVQKLFAASPRLLLDDSHFITQTKIPTKSIPAASSLNYHSSLKPSPTEKPSGPALQIHERNPNNDLGQLPMSIPHSANPSPIPLPLDNRPNPWCFHPPPNQWLIPVMSPSEGLIYKPYAGPCVPNSGFMAPFYGICGPSSMPTVTDNFMNIHYGLLGSRALEPNCYSTPSLNPVITASGVEQISPLTSTCPNMYNIQLSQNSCNTSTSKTIPLSGYPPKNDASDDSELHASTASSRRARAREGIGMLPLFPIAPAAERSSKPLQSCGTEHQARVIRVVPHNARSATESAARIFRSIQEERQQPYL